MKEDQRSFEHLSPVEKYVFRYQIASTVTFNLRDMLLNIYRGVKMVSEDISKQEQKRLKKIK